MTRAETLAKNLPGFTANGDTVSGVFADLAITITAPAKGATEVTIGSRVYPCSARVIDPVAWRAALARITTVHRMRADRRKLRLLADRVRDTLTHAEPGTISQVRKVITAIVFDEQEIPRGIARAQLEQAQNALHALDTERAEINAILSGAQPSGIPGEFNPKEPTP